MTDILTRAANAASETLGMSVEVLEGDPDVPLYNIEVWDAMDTPTADGPAVLIAGRTDTSALAYLEGLETGARIVRERHARLRRSADDTYLWCCTHAVAFRLTDICQSLKAALANLED